MRNKRKNSSFSGEVSIDGAEEDIEFDNRLARRLKRRLASDIDNELNSSGKNSFKGGKCNGALKKSEVVNLDIDGDSAFDMRLARRLKRSLSSNTGIKPNSSGRNSVSRSKCNVEEVKSQEGNFSIDDDNGDADADFKKYLDSLDDGNSENVPLQIEALNIDADANHVGNPKSKNRGEIVEDASYYRSYLNMLALEDENACFLDQGLDADAVDGFTENDCRAEDSVGEIRMICDASDADNFRKQERNSDCTEGVAAAVDAEPMENGTSRNFSKESDDIDANGGSFEIPSHKNVAFQDDDVADTDPAYEFVLKNMVKDTGVSSIDLSDSDGNNKTSQNDDFDYTDPDYELFTKNVRQEGKSLVLEIPALDGISQIIRYELGDTCGVDNLNTARSTKEDFRQPDLLDETYGEFIKLLKSERGLVVYTPECGAKVVYDADEEDADSSDSDVVILENDPFVPTYEIPSDEEEGNCNKSWNRKNDSWFRDEVLAILKQPFDRKEYNRLVGEATAHKPMIKERDLRGGRSIRHTVNKSGKSYLDVHKDLREQIRLAGPSEPKVLNLLRGFFYWLQNAPHEVFKPWKDEQCLQVMPSPEVSGKRKYKVSF